MSEAALPRGEAPGPGGRAGQEAAFADLVRDALGHLHEPGHLQTHPLTRFLSAEAGPRPSSLGRALRQTIVDAVESIRPATTHSRNAPGWRRHEVLRLRYLEGLEVSQVLDRLALSKSVYYVEQRRAVEALSAALRERWGLDAPGGDLTAADARDAEAEAARREALTNLPIQLTSFVGREREIAEVKGLLAATRLLTIVGSGGCGKTRLALEVAGQLLAAYEDGVWLVELASLTDPSLVGQAVAFALGVREQSRQPILRTLESALKARRALILLDNCEHLLDACASLAHALLTTCPSLRLLATSREALGIDGETSWLAPSLDLPPVGEPATAADRAELISGMERYDSVRLFVERARAIQPSFALTRQNALSVAQLCQRLDGVPLALELAAKRTRGLSVEQIVSRLDRRFLLLTGGSRAALPRQQTLRAAIDWSYDLLSEPERVLFRRLAVFSGGFPLEAAEEVCAGAGREATVERSGVMELLLRLVDRSLLVAEAASQGSRFQLLESLRQYGWERLEQAGEVQALRDRHRDWCLSFAEQTETELMAGSRTVHSRLIADYPNLRAALEWCLVSDAVTGLRLAGALWQFWWLRALLAEGRWWLNAVLAQRSESQEPRGKALLGLAFLTRFSQPSQAQLMAEESLSLLEEGGDLLDAGWALHLLGILALTAGDHEGAWKRLEESNSVFHAMGYAPGIGMNLRDLGWVALRLRGDRRQARELTEASLRSLRAVGGWQLAHTLVNLGALARDEGQLGQARELFEEALALHRQDGERFRSAITLCHLGQLARLEGDAEAARALVAESLADYRRVGGAVEGHTPSALWSYGLLAIDLGHPSRGTRLLAAATSQAFSYHSLDHDLSESSLATARLALGEEAFARAWAEGQAMTLEQAVEYALQDDAET